MAVPTNFNRTLAPPPGVRSKLRLSEVEGLIKKYRIIVPCPSRLTLIRMCEAGVFETARGVPGISGWLVFEDSFWQWARGEGSPV